MLENTVAQQEIQMKTSNVEHTQKAIFKAHVRLLFHLI